MLNDTPCPCGGLASYAACCGQYIEGKAWPPTPEALMRSRYTAYTLNNVSYIVATMRGEALKQFLKNKTRENSTEVIWEGLTVLSVVDKAPRLGVVTFEARYSLQGKTHAIREKSEFRKFGEKWYYINGKKKLQ